MSDFVQVGAINDYLATDFERDLFRAALANLADSANSLRFNNFAYALRELMRHVLKRLAPDEEVRACQWYREETRDANGISRRQRTLYAVQGGLSDRYVQSELGIDVLSMHTRLRDAVDNLSKHTHIEVHTFGLASDRVHRMVDEALEAVVQLFERVDECRRAVAKALSEHVDNEVVNQVLSETILEIDELASHHCIDDVYTDEVEVEGIDSRLIHIVARGTLGCELQWGSNSDLRRGDGAVASESFPFTCELKSPVESPSEFEADLATLAVDTSSWRDTIGPDEES